MMADGASAWVFVFWLSVISSLSAVNGSESHELVLTFDHSNFTDTVSRLDFVVVEFYAPWCGHCKKLAPEFSRAASILSNHDPPIYFAKVDADNEANKQLAAKFEIRGYPTLKILRNKGETVHDYKGPRQAEGIVEYLKRESGPASTEILSAENASRLIGDGKIAVIGLFPKFSGGEFENYLVVANKLRSDYAFGHTLDSKHFPDGDASATGPLVRLFKPFDELFADYKIFDVDVLEKFIEDSSIPLVTVFDKESSSNPFLVKFFSSSHAKAMLFMNFSDEVADSFNTKYREIAKQYRGQGIIFLVGDHDVSESAFQYFGLKEEQVPLIIIQTSDGKKYLKPNLDPYQISSWIEDYKDGKVAQYLKSQPIPDVNDEPVKVIVADNLDDVVFNSGKDVLIEFYAPWCGHCKKLAPILDEVAASYENDTNVIIAKLDATANDIPGDAFAVEGFPTMYLKSAGGSVVLYDGDRSKEDIIDFIQNNRERRASDLPDFSDRQADAEL